MNDRKGWLKEVFEDVDRDVKTWPNWLKDENSGAKQCSVRSDDQATQVKAKSANGD
jgi:hypothetical protein